MKAGKVSSKWVVVAAAFVLTTLLAQVFGPGAARAEKIVWDGSSPPQGVYFYWYEPSFYAGFAPRTQDSDRLHIRLSRGNQVRMTIVLGDEQLDAYLGDLLLRQKTVQELVDGGVIVPSTNNEFDRFVEKIGQAGVTQASADRLGMGPDAYREKTVAIMSQLNPGRVFRIRIPTAGLVQSWHTTLSTMGATPAAEQKLDAANAILPGRVNLYALSPELEAALTKATLLAGSEAADSPAFTAQAMAFLELATAGRYPVEDGNVEAIEFTAIYPAGTVQGWVDHKGEKLPGFGVTGIWKLTARKEGRGILGMVDYLSPNPGYGFITMLPYQHAGGIYYNAFHNAGVRSQLNSTPFLPPEWRQVAGERNPEKNYQNLWIVSRGPASHGCTRMASGHVSEMRHALPASSEGLEEVDTHRNLPQCFDVFDIDGDGSPEVMGIKYYLAYESQKHTPTRAYVTNERKAYYSWLYGPHIGYDDDGSASLTDVLTCRYVGKKAKEAQVFDKLPLYEADYAPDALQFYQVKPVSFESRQGFELNRELRKVGAGHTVDRSKLLLK